MLPQLNVPPALGPLVLGLFPRKHCGSPSRSRSSSLGQFTKSRRSVPRKWSAPDLGAPKSGTPSERSGGCFHRIAGCDAGEARVSPLPAHYPSLPGPALTCSGPLTPRSPTAFARVRQSVPRTPLMLHVLRGPAGRLAGGGLWLGGGGGPTHQRSQLRVGHVQQGQRGQQPNLGRQRRDIGVLEAEQF